MFEVIEDTLIDGVKLVPFLFITYLFMEILEHKMNNNISKKRLRKPERPVPYGEAF